MRKINTELLRSNGYEVVAVADGAAAWEALLAQHFDLIITDNVRPKSTGVELIKILKADLITVPVTSPPPRQCSGSGYNSSQLE
jgi:CheY-like chemotaxis protein